MRHGKRDGTDLPKPIAERNSNQTRAKQTDSANENGTLDTTSTKDATKVLWRVTLDIG